MAVEGGDLVRANQLQVHTLLVVTVALVIASVGALVLLREEESVLLAAPTTTVPRPTTTTTIAPRATVPASTDLASPNGAVVAYDQPFGTEIGKVGRWYGYPMTMPVLEDRGEWLRIRMPERPNGLTAWVKADSVSRSTSPWRMILRLSETRLYVYKDGSEAWSAPVGIGRDQTRTPTGSFFVAVIEKPGQRGYGPIVLSTNAHSEDIKSWKGSGDAITAFHGPFGSDKLIRSGGGKVSNGCVRMLTEDQLKMDAITLGTPVDIVD